MSDQESVLFLRAKADHVARNYPRAEALYFELLEMNPTHRTGRLMLGILFAQTHREAEAETVLASIILQDPENFEALSWQSGVLSTLKRFSEAKILAKRALVLRGGHLPTLLHFATACFGLEDFEEAAIAFRDAITIAPQDLAGYYGLSTSLLKLGDPRQARLVLIEAAKISDSLDTLLKLGEVCLACELPDETIAITHQILRRSGNHLNALLLQVRAFRLSQDGAGEESTLSQAISLAPESALAHALMGRRLQSLGKFEEAEKEFRISIDLNPRQGIAYYGVTSGRKIMPDDQSLIDSMEDALLTNSLSDDESAHLRYALGKSYENLGDFQSAMSHFDFGNSLMRQLRMGTRKFDREMMKGYVENIETTFTSEILSKSLDPVVQSIHPIIVAGIMRSGTTLLEQILSCHGEIGPGGEQTFWRTVEPECVSYESKSIHRERLRKIPLEYGKLLEKLAPGYFYVTDKNPANRTVYGLVHLAFPSAKIFHMQRNPVDVAISIYTTLIRSGAQFMGNKEDIVFALKMHDRLTRHWLKVLPAASFKIVQYENLVTNRNEVTRDAVKFLGLGWDDACLVPQSNQRVVLTPSLWQVRQPVYTSSLERWKSYEPWLGAFAELMESEAISSEG